MQKFLSFSLFFILQLGLWVGIALGLFALFWILYAEFFASKDLALDGASTKIGAVWFAYHSPSLNLSQTIIQRYIYPPLWHTLIIPLLTQPIWLFCLFTLGGNCGGMIVIHLLRRR